MKGFIVASLAIFAIACVNSHPHHQSIDNWQDLKMKKEELKTKLIGMSDDEYVTFRDQHLAKFEDLHAKFEVATPEERQQLIETIKTKIPAPLLAKLANLSAADKSKIFAKVQKFGDMTHEERQQTIDKMRAVFLTRMSQNHESRPQKMPEHVRQQIKNHFESLTPEEQQNLRHKFQHIDSAKPFESARPVLTEEDRMKIRQKFENLTPEQRDEIRRHHNFMQQESVQAEIAAASHHSNNFQQRPAHGSQQWQHQKPQRVISAPLAAPKPAALKINTLPAQVGNQRPAVPVGNQRPVFGNQRPAVPISDNHRPAPIGSGIPNGAQPRPQRHVAAAASSAQDNSRPQRPAHVGIPDSSRPQRPTFIDQQRPAPAGTGTQQFPQRPMRPAPENQNDKSHFQPRFPRQAPVSNSFVRENPNFQPIRTLPIAVTADEWAHHTANKRKNF